MNLTKVVKRNSLVLWRAWRQTLILSVVFPVLFLSAMGLGLGTLVEQGDPEAFGSAGYLAFFATGMLTVASMQTGVFSATYPMMNKLQWQKNYEAMLATPLQVRDLFLGELAWIGVLCATQVIPFFVVVAAFGVPESPLAILSIPISILVGLSFAAATMAWTGTLENDAAYSWLFRFVVTPMFLLGGTFFPVDTLPSWAIGIANLTPLYHGIELVRGVTLDGTLPDPMIHFGYLLVFLAAGVALGIRNFTKRLVA